MEIDFLEAEFIKQVLKQHVEGLKVFTQSDDPALNVAAISGFMGIEVSEEKAVQVLKLYQEQCRKAKFIIKKINSEFHLDE